MSVPRGFGRVGARPRVIGHRGARRPDPAGDCGPLPAENTILAFEEAERQGAEALELDVRVCATGQPVVLHDPTLKELTSGADTRAVAALPLAELRKVELAGGAAIPVLAEALEFARRRSLPVNVEIKRDVPSRGAVVDATARLLRAWDPKHPIVVSSFDPPMLAAIRARVPRVPVAILVEPKWHRLTSRLVRLLGAAGVHIERTLTFPSEIRALKARGLLVNVWTINDPEEARDLAALGVDGIITDGPAEIRAAFAVDAEFP